MGRFFRHCPRSASGYIPSCHKGRSIDAHKSPDHLVATRSSELPARIWRFEIPDYGIPDDVAGLDRMLDLIRERLDENESIVIHCAAGHGRTGMVATLLLARIGMQLEDAGAIGRAGSAPDMPAQRGFLSTRVAAW